MATKKKAVKKKRKPRSKESYKNNHPLKPAPKGNRFWERRSKHGRDKLFADPQLLWEACCEYFKWCEDTPFHEVDYRGKDITEVNIPKMRVMTIHGLTLYLGCNVQYLRDLEESLKAKDDELSRNFSLVIKDIRAVIYENKFTGAAAGFLNPNIIARDLGLMDRTDITSNEKPLALTAKVEIVHTKK